MRRTRDELLKAAPKGVEFLREQYDSDQGFVESDRYRSWRSQVEWRLRDTGAMLEKDAKHEPFLDHDPKLKATLERHRSALSGWLEQDDPAWKEISDRRAHERQERRSRAREKSREKDRGFGYGMQRVSRAGPCRAPWR